MSNLMLKRIRAVIKSNIAPKKGMTNVAVNDICLMLNLKLYQGVHAADRIPSHLHRCRQFTVIVNLATRREAQAVGHFITIYAQPEHIFYIDSFGLPCWQKDVRRFLKNCRRPVVFSDRQLQAVNSSHCGLYAILYTLYFDHPRRNFHMTFERNIDGRKNKKNDVLCIKYLNQLVGDQ